ncbi:hypothetical protein [Staphylococcus pseudoxylosus]|nr:hypothetical protein [Staphylococcus pseudoxylosus]MDW8547044.1 hypothetical protein [Staphylococcus pseudoxylosus]
MINLINKKGPRHNNCFGSFLLMLFEAMIRLFIEQFFVIDMSIN